MKYFQMKKFGLRGTCKCLQRAEVHMFRVSVFWQFHDDENP